MERKSLFRIGEEYQKVNPDKIILFRIPNPFSVRDSEVLASSPDEIVTFILRNRPLRLNFYDDSMVVNVQALDVNDKPITGSYVDYYFFKQEYYNRAKDILRQERECRRVVFVEGS